MFFFTESGLFVRVRHGNDGGCDLATGQLHYQLFKTAVTRFQWLELSVNQHILQMLLWRYDANVNVYIRQLHRYI